jgi:purine-binding chemotaxis protein CheW
LPITELNPLTLFEQWVVPEEEKVCSAMSSATGLVSTNGAGLGTASARTSAAQRTGKYLIFSLADEEFGIHVLKIKEIMGMQDITSVPNTPPYVRGVINLRGQVIPVLDLRMKFSLTPCEYTHRTCIVVVTTKGSTGERLVGAIADGVAEVLTLAEEDIEDTPDFGSGTVAPYLLGMAKVKGRVKILLEIDQVLSTQEQIDLQELSKR